jgi:hypothetical protein
MHNILLLSECIARCIGADCENDQRLTKSVEFISISSFPFLYISKKQVEKEHDFLLTIFACARVCTCVCVRVSFYVYSISIYVQHLL